MQVVIDTRDTSITVKNKCFLIQNKSVSRQISPKRISSIAILTNCILNTSAIKLAANHQVPILFFNNFGTIQARLWSPYFTNIADLRKKQMIFSMSELATDWVIQLLNKKTKEQVTNLKRLVKRKTRFKKEVTTITKSIEKIQDNVTAIKNSQIKNIRNTLMGYEGSISRHYFQALNLFMPEDFKFEQRSRRPALDYFNAGLNYLYGMTYSVVESAVFAKGLDPFIGILHADYFNRPTLVFDLIEPIRPLIDRILLELISSKQLLPEYFVKKGQGYWIGKKGKRVLIGSFNNFLQKRIVFDGSARRIKDHIFEESNQLGNLINDSIELR